MGIFNHVQIKVKSLQATRKFYDELMNVLGHKVVLDIERFVVGYGTSVHDMFEIHQSSEEAPLSRAVHVAFNAKDKETVDNFYRVALENGAKCNGGPGYRPEYEDGYYAAFIIDIDGHNVEAVYSEQIQKL